MPETNSRTPWRVKQGGSVMSPDGSTLYVGGTKLPNNWPAKCYKDAHENGYIERDWYERPDELTDTPPGLDVNNVPVIPGLDSTQGGGGARIVANPDAGSEFRTTDPAIVRSVVGESRPTSSVTSNQSGVTTTNTPTKIPRRQTIKGDDLPTQKTSRDSGGQSKWNINPADLAGLSLDQLNAMILERDGSIPPFETVSEASAFLSSDFPA